ncbi:AAEL009277-PA [Aedes aegypti]|uniref:AAEL009277-PA n=1 Tax=Aedes aegypti TaxID=7159 RepID=Q16WA9_AEDAE|nr:AAEL009277-PA [Aedes aegypti]
MVKSKCEKNPSGTNPPANLQCFEVSAKEDSYTIGAWDEHRRPAIPNANGRNPERGSPKQSFTTIEVRSRWSPY